MPEHTENQNLQLPAEKEVHIWLLDLNEYSSREPWYEYLAPDEKKRADRILESTGSNHYLVSQGLLRSLLATYLHISPADIQLTKNFHGKPELSGQQNKAQLRFNLSHSRNMALYAFVTHASVGIDLEMIQPEREILNIAKRFFHPEEYSALSTLPANQQAMAFYNAWSQKEAVMKAIGAGLSYGLDKIILPGINAEQAACFLVTTGKQSWEVHAFDFSDAFAAAVALEDTDWNIHWCTPLPPRS